MQSPSPLHPGLAPPLGAGTQAGFAPSASVPSRLRRAHSGPLWTVTLPAHLPASKADSHWLSVLHMVMYVSMTGTNTHTVSDHPTFSLPHCVQKSVLCICVPIAA